MKFLICILLWVVFFSCKNNKEEKIKSSVTYYISSSGSDLNSGMSEKEAWRTLKKVNSVIFSPGDSILFRSGDIWIGQLNPKGSGSLEHYIYLGSYGKGRKPYIAGDGISGILGATLLLYNSNYWKIEGLDISNMPQNRHNDVRFGILVRWDDYGTGKGVTISNCRIHDVAGIKTSRFQGDGIMVIAAGDSIQTNYEDILIEDCEIMNIDRTGITIWSQWYKRFNIDYGPNGGAYKASRGVIIRNNYLENIAGDGILVSCTNGALIERNRVFKANQGGIDPNAGIWPHNSDSVIMQYNEVSHTGFSGDGQGFDIDMLCFDCISQYNYSHNNAGGFHLICSEGREGRSSRNIIRYNKSINDQRYIFSFVGSIDSTYVYGNEIVVEDSNALGMFTSWDWNGKPSNTFFYDNKIKYLGEGENAMKDTVNFVSEGNIWQGNSTVFVPQINK